MKWVGATILLTIGIMVWTGCNKPAEAPRVTNEIDPVRGHLLHAQPKLRTIKVWLGDQELITEIARAPVQIATGMMFRTNLLENEAMLFVFPDAAPKNFYMRNCVVPLSAAYIAPDGTILEIVDLQPGDEKGVPSKSSNVRFVLEVPKAGSSATTSAPARSCARNAGRWPTLFSADANPHHAAPH